MDFEKFYNEQPDYDAFRNDDRKREEYINTVDWKARKLALLAPADMKFANIMEVGCALGILLNNVADRLSVEMRTGIDISVENINFARKLYPECNFIQGTIEDSAYYKGHGLKDLKFDLVLLSDIVEHIPDDLAFMKRVSEISSYVLLNLPLEKALKNRKREYGESDPSGHLRSYDRKMAEQLISQADFELVSSFTSAAASDKLFYKFYSQSRKMRLQSKPLPKRLFWTSFYYLEDQVKRSNSRFSERIYGTNYFALLKSRNYQT